MLCAPALQAEYYAVLIVGDEPDTTSKLYTLPEASFVVLRLYDICGREVATLVNEHLPAGSHQITFDGQD